MKIMGMDGYLGWPLAMHLTERGHDVSGLDNFSRRSNVEEMGSQSATPIPPMGKRLRIYEKARGKRLRFYEGDLTDTDFTDGVIEKEKPDCIVHLGEIPSAPYSMIDVRHCNHTQINNIIGTNNILFAVKKHAPKCHLLKLGTMGSTVRRTSTSRRASSRSSTAAGRTPSPSQGSRVAGTT